MTVRVHVEAGQAQVGDEFQVAGLTFRVTDVEHVSEATVTITAELVDGDAFLEVSLDPEAPWEVIPSPGTYRPLQECDPL